MISELSNRLWNCFRLSHFVSCAFLVIAIWVARPEWNEAILAFAAIVLPLLAFFKFGLDRRNLWKSIFELACRLALAMIISALVFGLAGDQMPQVIDLPLTYMSLQGTITGTFMVIASFWVLIRANHLRERNTSA